MKSWPSSELGTGEMNSATRLAISSISTPFASLATAIFAVSISSVMASCKNISLSLPIDQTINFPSQARDKQAKLSLNRSVLFRNKWYLQCFRQLFQCAECTFLFIHILLSFCAQ
jgi:hypothetical protein